MAETPPLGAPNPTMRLCTRRVGVEAGREVLCGAVAIEHVIFWWNDDPTLAAEDAYDHGFVCGRHWAEYQREWSCAGHHEMNEACGMPGSRIHPSRPCWFEDLPVAEPTRAIATEVAHV